MGGSQAGRRDAVPKRRKVPTPAPISFLPFFLFPFSFFPFSFFLFSFSFFVSLFPFSFFLFPSPCLPFFLFLFFFKNQIACTAFVTRLADGAGMAACDGCDCDAYGDGSQRWRLSWDRVQQSNSISNLCFLLLALVAVLRVCPGRASTEWNFPNTTPLILSTACWTPIRSNPIHFNWLA